MSDSKSGSKDNLNESNMPLLSDDGAEKAGETPEKEVVEMELDEKKDTNTEKEESVKEEKKKKEKKVKVPKEKGPSCIDIQSASLDLAARDKRGINTEINVRFFFEEICGIQISCFSLILMMFLLNQVLPMDLTQSGDFPLFCSAKPNSGSIASSLLLLPSLSPSSGPSSSPSSQSSMSGSSVPSSGSWSCSWQSSKG